MSPVETVLYPLLRLCRVFTVDLVGAVVFWPVFLVVVGLLAFLLRRAMPQLRDKLWLLPILPLAWIAAGLSGVFFASDPDAPIRGGNPGVENALVFGFVGFLLAWVLVIYSLRQAKLFAALFAVTNLYFMAGMSIAAYVEVAGLRP